MQDRPPSARVLSANLSVLAPDSQGLTEREDGVVEVAERTDSARTQAARQAFLRTEKGRGDDCDAVFATVGLGAGGHDDCVEKLISDAVA